jgi:cell fate (sporulation/competence/biofilm development) regulator YmcA (YheA/YmcA/DUF963 family)
MYVKVKDTPNLIRDMQNQAVLNSDLDGLKAYKLKREKQQEINSAVDDINNIKQDINELKTLMQRILDKIG